MMIVGKKNLSWIDYVENMEGRERRLLDDLEKLAAEAKKLFGKEVMSGMLADSKNSDSYFIDREDDNYITGLELQTPVQLRSMLQEMWGSELCINGLINILVVLAFKLKEQSMANESIKDRIYNF